MDDGDWRGDVNPAHGAVARKNRMVKEEEISTVKLYYEVVMFERESDILYVLYVYQGVSYTISFSIMCVCVLLLCLDALLKVLFKYIR